MATYTATYSGRSQYKLELTVTLKDQTQAGSTFTWTLRAVADPGYGSWALDNFPWEVHIGSASASGTASLDFRPESPGKKLTLGSGTTARIGHATDGTLSLTVSAKHTTSSVFGSANTGNRSMSVPTIPRTSDPTISPTTLDAGTSMTITTNRASSSFTHVVKYKFGSASGTIGSSVGASVSWTPPLSLLSQIPNSTSGGGTITVDTYSGSTKLGSKSKSFTLRAPSSVTPSISSLTLADLNGTVNSVVGANAYVQGFSVLRCTVNASGAYGSTISSRTFKVGSSAVVNSGSSIALGTAGTQTVTGYAKDSRGRTTSKSQSISVLAYKPPTVTRLIARRANSSGTAQDDGTYIRVDLTAAVQSLVYGGSEKNLATIVTQTKPVTSSTWTTRNTWNSGLSYNGAYTVSGGAIAPVTQSLDVRITVTDKMGETYVADTTVASASVTLDLNGEKVGVGKFWERGVLDVGGQIYQNNNRVIDETMPALYVGHWVNPAESKRRSYIGTGVSGTGATESYIGMASADDDSSLAFWFQYAGTTLLSLGKDGKLRNEYLPIASAAGTIAFSGLTANNPQSVAITFPSGRFNNAPVVMTTVQSGVPQLAHSGSTAPTATGVTIYAARTDSGSTLNVRWLAVQQN